MSWMRNKENNFPISILIWSHENNVMITIASPAFILHDKFHLALYPNYHISWWSVYSIHRAKITLYGLLFMDSAVGPRQNSNVDINFGLCSCFTFQSTIFQSCQDVLLSVMVKLVDKESCSRTEHSATGESWTSDPLIKHSTTAPLYHCSSTWI